MKRTGLAEVTRVGTTTTTGAPAPAARALARDDGAVDALRRRLAGSAARDHVVLDFLQDDLDETRAALAAVAAWVANVEAALADPAPSAERLTALARAATAPERVDYLGATLGSVRRRLAQVAARMG